MTPEMIRRTVLFGGFGLTLTGCFDRPWYEENPKQKAFLEQLQAIAKPALASNNPLKLEEAVKQSLALAAQTGAFTDWQGILRTIEGNAQKKHEDVNETLHLHEHEKFISVFTGPAPTS